jgi:hypothetical protein
MKLTGSVLVTGFIPNNGPENAISRAVAVPQIAPTNTPRGLAKGTNRAKKNRAKMGVTNRFVVFCVTAEMLPGTYCTITYDPCDPESFKHCAHDPSTMGCKLLMCGYLLKNHYAGTWRTVQHPAQIDELLIETPNFR